MESKVKQLIAVGLVFGLFLVGKCFFVSNNTFADNQKYVRILIIKDAAEFVVSIRGKYTIGDPKTDTTLESRRVLKKSKVKPWKKGMWIGKKYYPHQHIRLWGQKDIQIFKGNKYRKFRGDIDIFVDDKGRFMLINTLDLESYIKGVLYHEVSNKWPMEAMKAQAIAARTYALYQIEENKDQLYDVRSDIYSQVYGGRSAERYRTSLAVERTEGLILTYKDKVLPAYFHANCGGHTENVKELWKHNHSPLRGVKCPFCKLAPAYDWQRNLQLKEVQRLLNAKGYRLGLIKDIRVTSYNRSGRIKTLVITDRQGIIKEISGKDFRNIIGPNNLRSNKYKIEMKGYYVDFIGRGWGHGVGMCQWGANIMSQKRFKFQDILMYYYPSAKIKKL